MKCVDGFSSELALPAPLEILGLEPQDLNTYRNKLQEILRTHLPYRSVQHLEASPSSTRARYREVFVTPVMNHNGRHLLLEASRDVSLVGRTLHELARYSPGLSSLLRQSSQRVWELDLSSRILCLYDPHRQSEESEFRKFRFPDDLIARNFVHPESYERFRTFSRKILGGEKEGIASLVLRSLSGSGYSWYSVSFQTMFDAQHLPQKVFGIVSVIETVPMQPRLLEYGQLWKFLLPSLFCYVCANLSKDRVLHFWLSGRFITTNVTPLTYSDLSVFGFAKIFSPDTRETLQRTLSADRLIALPSGDLPTWFCEPCEFVESDTYVRPATLHALVDREENGDTLAFFFLQFSDKPGSEENRSLLPHARLDEFGLYPPEEQKNLIERYLTNTTHECAHAVIRFRPSERLRTTQDFRFVAASFGTFFEPNGLVSLFDDHTLSLFLPECDSFMQARQRLESAFDFVRKTLPDSSHSELYFAAAMTQGILEAKHLDDFLTEASLVCSRLENLSVDTIEFVAPIQDLRLTHSCEALLHQEQPGDSLITDSAKEMSKTEMKLLLASLDHLVRTPGASLCLHTILGEIGHYYRADRVYTLRLVGGMSEIEETAQWNSENKSSIKGILTGLSIRKFPLLS